MRHATTDRVHSIDILRGLAIFFMIFVHYGQTWLTPEELIAFSPFYFIPSFIGAPIFLILVGISFSLSAERRKNAPNFKKHVIKRALLLICLQFLLNMVIFEIEQVWTYEVLILIGVSQLVCYFLMDKPDTLKILIVVLSMILVPILYDLLGYTINLLFFFDPIWNFNTFLKASIVNWPFCILPYISYMIFGMMIGNAMVLYRTKGDEIEFCKKLVVYGLLLILIGIGFRIFNSPIIDFFEEGLHVFLTTGLVMILLSGLYWMEDVKNISILRPFSQYGQISLTFLLGHHFINKYICVYLFSMLKVLSIYPYLLLIVFFCISYWIIARFWRILNYKYSLDWMLRKLSQ